MRLILCWAQISGYMAACWRALAAVPGVDLRVIAFEVGQKTFADELVTGINCRILSETERDDENLIRSLVSEHRPDVVFTSGWFHRAYRRLLYAPELANTAKWIGVDTPWRGTLKQQFARVALRGLVGHVDGIFVAGERAWQYMRAVGACEQKLRRGLYGIDYDSLSPLHGQRRQRAGGWPKRFLFIGRYTADKGIATMVEAYARYRASVSDPWPLDCCGTGELRPLLVGQPGITEHGFQQPAQLFEMMRDHGAFVLSSHFDPWPLVVVESCAAGLPVLCTESCGSAVELVRPYYNGVTVATDDVAALARGMRWMHDHYDELPEMGGRGLELAASYSAQAWATRWAAAVREAMDERERRPSAGVAAPSRTGSARLESSTDA